jgi:tRNA modification GTPase
MTLPDLSSTIVALATPPGVGAIGVIRLSGPRAILVADKIFKGKRLENQPSHTAHFGKIVAEDGRILDEVLITTSIGPNSYTGEDTAEISCHGSPYILQEIIQLCLGNSARLAEPGEFTLRAFLNGKMDLTQAEAVADLIASESAAAHDIAIRQLRGGFKHEIQKLREELIHFASLVELELDFGRVARAGRHDGDGVDAEGCAVFDVSRFAADRPAARDLLYFSAPNNLRALPCTSFTPRKVREYHVVLPAKS